MLTRRIVLSFAAILPLALTSVAAGAAEKFTDAALAAAQQAGKPVLVEVAAPWCPTCKAQRPIIDKLTGTEKYKGFVLLTVDFDSQKDALRKLNARSQSTLIVYKGQTEVGRSVGDTNPASVEALLAKAL